MTAAGPSSFSRTIEGQPAQLLPGIVEASLNDLPIPKRMRWAARKEEFVRPTQWLVMLFGEQVIDCEILAQRAGRESRGHRFHSPGQVHILQTLQLRKTCGRPCDRRLRRAPRADRQARRAAGVRAERQCHRAAGAARSSPPWEWPVPLVCSFEDASSRCRRALISTMQDNQKYFCLLDTNGKLLPRFITVANIESKDPAQIVSGNEGRAPDRRRVLLQAGQEAAAGTLQRSLKNVVFQAQLGTVYDKAERVSPGRADRRAHRRRQAARARRPAQGRPGHRDGWRVSGDAGIAGYYYALNEGRA